MLIRTVIPIAEQLAKSYTSHLRENPEDVPVIEKHLIKRIGKSLRNLDASWSSVSGDTLGLTGASPDRSPCVPYKTSYCSVLYDNRWSKINPYSLMDAYSTRLPKVWRCLRSCSCVKQSFQYRLFNRLPYLFSLLVILHSIVTAKWTYEEKCSAVYFGSDVRWSALLYGKTCFLVECVSHGSYSYNFRGHLVFYTWVLQRA